MKVFISWSGPLSRQIAEVLQDWLPSVLQTVEPYVSSEDIYKGARWNVDVSRELEAANYGILCVTATNIDARWLNFEAGALSKSFEKGHVSPFLFDIEPSNVTGPLLQFQSTVYEREDVFKLVRLNSRKHSGRLAGGNGSCLLTSVTAYAKFARRKPLTVIRSVSVTCLLESGLQPTGVSNLRVPAVRRS